MARAAGGTTSGAQERMAVDISKASGLRMPLRQAERVPRETEGGKQQQKQT